LLALLLASLVLGIVLSFVYVLIKDGAFVFAAVRVARFPRYSIFRDELKRSLLRTGGSTILADLVVPFLGGVGLVFITFIYNYGKLRLLSVPFLLIGYFVALRFFSTLIAEILIAIFYICKIIFGIAFLPIFIIGKYLCSPMCRIIKKACMALLTKAYTAYRFKRLVRKGF
jgi:hypothetical protein